MRDTVLTLDAINDIWKSFALLGRGPAYAARNLMDTSARSIAYMGGHNYATNVLARIAPKMFGDRAAQVDIKAVRSQIQSDLADAQTAMRAAQADRPLADAIEQDPLVAQLNHEIEAHQTALDALDHFGQAPVQVGDYQFKGSFGSTPQEASAANQMVSAQDVRHHARDTE